MIDCTLRKLEERVSFSETKIDANYSCRRSFFFLLTWMPWAQKGLQNVGYFVHAWMSSAQSQRLSEQPKQRIADLIALFGIPVLTSSDNWLKIFDWCFTSIIISIVLQREQIIHISGLKKSPLLRVFQYFVSQEILCIPADDRLSSIATSLIFPVCYTHSVVYTIDNLSW